MNNKFLLWSGRCSFNVCGTFLLILLLSICTTTYSQKKKKDKLSEDARMTLDRTFVDAHREKTTGSIEKAITLFQQCISIDKENAASYFEISKLLRTKNENAKALEMAETAYKLNNANEWYAMEYAEQLQINNRNEDAAEIYEALIKRFPEQLNYTYMQVSTYLNAGKDEEALKILDKIEKLFGIDPELTREKQRIYLKMGKLDKAAEELEKLIKQYPTLDHYGLLVELYQVNGVTDKAYEVIQRMQAIDAKDPRVALSLAEYYRSKGDKTKSYEQLKEAFKSTSLPAETKTKILLSYLPTIQASAEMKEQATELSKLFVETNPNESSAHAFYGELLMQDKKYGEAREHFLFCTNSDNQNFGMWQQLLSCDLQLSDWEALKLNSNQAKELFPSQPVVFLYNGIAHSQLKEYDNAVKSLTAGSKLLFAGDPLLIDFYSNLGDNYNNLKKFEDSDKYYEKALKADSQNETVLNNWAYYLSLRKDRLDKAEEMAKKVTTLSPNNATYLDTYGWVLYMKGDYTGAKGILEVALKHGGDSSGAILEHYGDVLFKLNDTVRALEYWQKAEKAGDASELIKQKVYEKKLFEQ
ncbi:MAG: tetratricopeptide repeat protein [Bacteroidetes bacterium]|nr:tetratricopeptide repeat protein [Bacteroidota bacterium]